MFYSPEHDTIVYKTDRPGVFLNNFKGAARLNGEYVALPATLENLQTARRIDLPVVAPMRDYDWPIREGWAALPHQKVTANFLALNPHSFCFNDMGTMKTLSALWAADFIMQEERKKGNACRCLIVAPLSILRIVWESAVFTHFLGRRSAVVLHGSAKKRQALLAKEADFYVINPDGLAIGIPARKGQAFEGLASDLDRRTDIKLVVVDEASAYRTANTRRHAAARKLLAGRPYLWLLTGTPTPNGPLDAYGLAKLMGRTTESFNLYKQRVMLQLDQWKWVPRTGAGEIVREMLQPAVRFNSDFLKLPPCTPEMREVPFSKEQEHAYKKLKTDAVLMLKSGGVINPLNQAALRMKLIQIAAGAVYDRNHESHDVQATPRLEECRAIIEETERKVIIFAPLTNVLNMLYQRLDGWERAIVNGNVGLAERGRIFRKFLEPHDPLRLLFLDPASVSHGINELVSASVAIWYAPTDKAEHYQQGNKRIDRPGQTGPTKIIQLVSTPIEKEIYKRLERQENMQGLILKLAEE